MKLHFHEDFHFDDLRIGNGGNLNTASSVSIGSDLKIYPEENKKKTHRKCVNTDSEKHNCVNMKRQGEGEYWVLKDRLGVIFCRSKRRFLGFLTFQLALRTVGGGSGGDGAGVH